MPFPPAQSSGGKMKSISVLCLIFLIVSGSVVSADLPSSFDLRDVSGYNYVTSVKNQTGGTCWTHGTMASIESDLIMSGEWQAVGDTGEPNLAEYHLDWWNGFNQFYNEDILPDSGEGLEVHYGGDYYVSAAYLARGEGAVRDIDGQSFSSPPSHFGYEYHTYYPRDIEWYTANEDLSNIDIIKEKLMTQGAIATCLFSGPFIQNGIHYQPASDPNLPNHSVTIVGWDDTLVTQAPNPGAWLCKNSWGSNWAYDGYFWISYDDKYCAKDIDMGAVAFNNVELLPGNRPKYFYYHDYHGWRTEELGIAKGFNAFTAVRSHALEGASFYTTGDSVGYTLRIYDSFDGIELSDELGSKSGHIQHRGFHTVDLTDTIPMTKGDDFYVYVEFSNGGHAFDMSSEIPVLLGSDSRAFVRSTATPKQSYIFDYGEWRDVYHLNSSANLCIKAIANDNLTSPIKISSIDDGGDGKSLRVNWEFIREYDTEIDFVRMYYSGELSRSLDSVTFAVDEPAVLLNDLVENEPYFIYATAFTPGGDYNPEYEGMTGIPSSQPQAPENTSTVPAHRAIQLIWAKNNTELDFHHYQLIRDGVLLSTEITDTTYLDNDPTLGNALHEYIVIAFDEEGIQSDTAGQVPVIGKAALLSPGTIMALNKSHPQGSMFFVQCDVTGQFMHEALAQYDYEYSQDTEFPDPLPSLYDIIDYELIIIGAESARYDDLIEIGYYPRFILDIKEYMSLGGKVIIFGRWGFIKPPGDRRFVSIDYQSSDPAGLNHAYYDVFDIVSRTEVHDALGNDNGFYFTDGFCTGAQSLEFGYPELFWDSLLCESHTPVFHPLNGIPATSLIKELRDGATPIYEFLASDTTSQSIGTISAWKNENVGSKYVFFELPLSFMERSSAIQALQQAIYSLDVITDVSEENADNSLPRVLTLYQNYPNPFNPSTTIEFYNPGSKPLKTKIEVYNIVGQLVYRPFDGYASPGVNQVVWNGQDQNKNDVASGVYFYRISTNSASQAKKMILLR